MYYDTIVSMVTIDTIVAIDSMDVAIDTIVF